jgi:hypothetical protein
LKLKPQAGPESFDGLAVLRKFAGGSFKGGFVLELFNNFSF